MASPTPLANAAPSPLDKLLPNPKGKLKDQFHEVARFKHFSQRTETTYWEWVVRDLKFHKARAGAWRHPRDLGSQAVTPSENFATTNHTKQNCRRFFIS